jgi:hypothetical protein
VVSVNGASRISGGRKCYAEAMSVMAGTVAGAMTVSLNSLSYETLLREIVSI